MYMVMDQTKNSHPAARWAVGQCFSPLEVACTTAVVLKILDGKCKMLPGEQAAILAIYEVVRCHPSQLFTPDTHSLIAAARSGDQAALPSIHALRLLAEEQIPKPVMKGYKARLRAGLFG